MRKFVIGLAVGLLLGSVFITTAGEVFYKGRKVYVLADQENLRDAPNGKKIGSVLKGTQMVVLEDNEKWVQVGLTAFIWRESLTGQKEKLGGQAYRALMIVVKTEQEAKEILTKIKSGEDFAILAKEKSIDNATAKRGGDLGEFYKGDFAPEIERSILSLNVNQVSGIVKTQAGYAIFKRIK